MHRGIATPLIPTFSRLREKGLPLPQAGEGWGEGARNSTDFFHGNLLPLAGEGATVQRELQRPCNFLHFKNLKLIAFL